MQHKISKYVYGILSHGQVVIATLDDEQNPLSSQSRITELVTSHRHDASMVFPATPENYDALQVLYEGHGVPKIPLEPNDIVRGLLKHHRKFVIVKASSESYALAREKLNSQANLAHSGSKFGGKYGSWAFMVPYDVHGNEITELPDE